LTNGELNGQEPNGNSSTNGSPTRPKRSENIFAEAIITNMSEAPDNESIDDVLSRLSPRAKRVLEESRQEASSLGAAAVCTQHVLLGILRQEDCCAAKILTDLGFDYEEIRRRIEFITGFPAREGTSSQSLNLSPRMNHALDLAGHDATRRGHTEVGTIHLLVSLLRTREGLVVTVLETAGLGLEPVGAAIVRAFRADTAHDS
jgi:ATP-dependent Clp protease ATP-binding subunit ClpC